MCVRVSLCVPAPPPSQPSQSWFYISPPSALRRAAASKVHLHGYSQQPAKASRMKAHSSTIGTFYSGLSFCHCFQFHIHVLRLSAHRGVLCAAGLGGGSLYSLRGRTGGSDDRHGLMELYLRNREQETPHPAPSPLSVPALWSGTKGHISGSNIGHILLPSPTSQPPYHGRGARVHVTGPQAMAPTLPTRSYLFSDVTPFPALGGSIGGLLPLPLCHTFPPQTDHRLLHHP